MRLAAILLAACGGGVAAPAGPPTGAIEAAAAMTQGRAAHTATILPNGLVLVAGGLHGQGSTATAELFDSHSRTFRATGSMASARADHCAVLLPDGRVLIAGGFDGNFLATTEIYDPGSGAFVAGPAMAESRSGAIAVALPGGKVLIAGGVGGTSASWIFRASAEIYDPAKNTFSRAGDMTAPRESHTATLLPDGRVLITGGHAGRGPDIRIYSSAELYDPSTGTFSASGSMARIRHKHDAALLPDGRVMIAGGADQRDDQGQYRDTEVYSGGSFSPGADMLYTRYKHKGTSIALAGGRILIAGGAARPEVFDAAAGAFRPVAGSVDLRGNFSAVAALPEGRVLITGGYGNGQGPSTGAWVFSP